MSFREALFADYEANFKRRPSWPRVLTGYFLKAGFRAAFLYRVAHWARQRSVPAVGPLLDRWIRRSCHIDFCSLADVGPGLYLPHPVGIVIGSGVRIGRNCHILQGVTLGGAGGKSRADGTTQPRVGDNVLIGAGAKILGPVDIGNGVRIGANAVVTRDLPDNCTAVGIPARILPVHGEPAAEPARPTGPGPSIPPAGAEDADEVQGSSPGAPASDGADEEA